MRVPKPAEVEPIHQQTLECFYAGFKRALEAVDLPAGGSAAALDVDPAIARAARASVNRLPAPGGGRLTRILRQAQPVLEPLAAPVLPLVGRWARRGAP